MNYNLTLVSIVDDPITFGVERDDHGQLQWMLMKFSEPSATVTKHQQVGEKYNVHILVTDLRSCSMKRDIQWGRRIHRKAVEREQDSNIYVVTALIRMYAKCRSMVEARHIFNTIQNPDVVSWTALLLGYVENGDGLATLQMFSKMKASGCTPDSVSYMASLKACASLARKRDSGEHEKWLEQGRAIHSEIDCDLGNSLQNTLIDMYAKCKSMSDARRVFDNIRKPDVVSWNALLLGYAENGDGLAALDLFSKMKSYGYTLDSVTYIAALKACTYLAGNGNGGGQSKWLKRGREIHSEIGCELGISVQNTLIGMYAKCGSMTDACSVFESIQKPNVVSWNAILLGYVENGEGSACLEWFSKMKVCRCLPSSITYVVALKACTSLAGNRDQDDWLVRGREIHAEIGCGLNIYLQSTLIDMYAKFGSMVEAHNVFESMHKPNVVSWTALLLGYAENGEGLAALELFSRMKDSGCEPDSVAFIAALKACTSLAIQGEQGDWLKRGREIHSEISCDSNIFLQSTLINMYGKCGSMVDARSVFESVQKPNVVCWTALLMGYAENGDGLSTLEWFTKMNDCGCAPNSVTYVAVLKACGIVGALSLGRKIQSDITEFTPHIVTCLVDFYAKCGSMIDACEVFEQHATARVVPTWNSLLAGYASFGDTDSVIKLFESMQDQGFQPDDVTFVCMLSCFSHAVLPEKAWEYFEAMTSQYGITPTIMHYTCMVDVLGRANQLTEAISLLQKMPCNPETVTWMTLLAACRKWHNVEIGRRAFQSLMDMDKKNAFAYVLMADIYGSMGMREEQERVLATRIKLGACEILGQAYVIDEVGNMLKFVDGEEDPPEVKDNLNRLLEELKQRGYYVESCSMQGSLCGHSERRAVLYGILKTSLGETVKAFKNMRMCDVCHASTKMISKISGRVIMVRDASRFHVMVNGSCSCSDYW